MHSKLLIGGLLSSVVIVSAFAQSSPPAPSAPPAQSNPPMAAPAPASKPADTAAAKPASQSGQWRASKLVGLNVYNDQNEKLGDISEILLDKSGKVEGVIIGVGGFLGMGQRDIKVEMSKLKFVDEPPKAAATSTTQTTGTGANRPAAQTTTTTRTSSDKKWYPDHAVLSGATKDQLKAMPEFKYN
jgi:sporulation protein YlmC with PRC-barrel domain